MKRLLLVVLAAGLTLMGCDQSDYDTDYEIPDGQEEGFVQFANPDTVTVRTTGSADIGIESPDAAARQEGYTASFEASGEAVAGEDYTIPDVEVRDSTAVVDTVNVDPDELNDFLSDFDDDDVVVVDTLDAESPDPVVRVELTQYSVESYTVEFDEGSSEGTVTVEFDDLGLLGGNTIDDALVSVQGLQNDDADGPRTFTLTITGAQTESGEPLFIGRQPNNFNSSKVVVVGEADEFED